MDVLSAGQNFSESLTEVVRCPSQTVRALWLTGISASFSGLILQTTLLWLLPNCRRYDEFVLLQLTIVRVLNTIGEYMLLFKHSFVPYYVLMFWNFYTDLSLACWMFVFTKNLFDRVVLVFVNDNRHRLLITSTITWLVPAPLALVAPYEFSRLESSTTYYVIFCTIKLIITSINGLMFIVIFRVASAKLRSDPQSRTMKELLKISFVTFLLSCISSLQVLTTDLLSVFQGSNYMLIEIFCVINSYQVCATTIIFLILIKKSYNKSIIKTVADGVIDMCNSCHIV